MGTESFVDKECQVVVSSKSGNLAWVVNPQNRGLYYSATFIVEWVKLPLRWFHVYWYPRGTSPALCRGFK